MDPKKLVKPAKSTAINSKADIRNASAKVGKLLRGIDNDTAAVVKMKDQIDKKIGSITQSNGLVKDLVAGISTAALATPEPPKTKPVKAPPTPKAAKPVKAPAKPKPAKPPVKKVEKAPVAKPLKPPAKKTNGDKSSVAIDERPPLRQLLSDLISSKKSIKSSDIYHNIEELADTAGFAVWSRQSVYSLLKKLVEQNEIVKSGDGADAIYSLPAGQHVVATDDEADRLISKVESSSAVAAVQ